MKFGFMIICSLLMIQAHAWEVKTVKTDFYLVDKDESYSIVSEGGTPKFVKSEELNPQLLKLIYFAGTAGTSDPCDIHRALVITKKTKKVVGDFPVSYKCTSSELEKATWILKDKTLEVSDPQTEMTQKVTLP